MPSAVVPENTGDPLSPPLHVGPETVTQVGKQAPPHKSPAGAKSVSSTNAQL
jgi:hypothetical protein